MEYVIDAQGKNIGRVASEAAHVLMGKNDPSFEKHTVSETVVKITNSDKLAISQKKAEEKVYDRYSGHPGGRKVETLEEVVAKKGHEEILRKAVYGMLPGNKLRARMMKHLIIE